MAVPVKTGIYRSLLRLAALHDRNPVLKAVINWSAIPSLANEPWASYFRRLTVNNSLYHPGPGGAGTSLTSLIQEAYRDHLSTALPDSPAFDLMRALSDNAELLKALKGGPSGAAPPALPPKLNLRLESTPAVGRFLVSHPAVNGPLARSVLLITRHDKDETLAFMVGQPAKPFATEPQLMQKVEHTGLKDEWLYHGGPMQSDVVLHVFHRRKLLTPEGWGVSEGEGRKKRMLFQRLEDARVCPGLYCSFVTETVLSSATLQLTLNETRAQEMAFFRGLVGWLSSDMQQQLANQEWFVVSADPVEALVFPEQFQWAHSEPQQQGHCESGGGDSGRGKDPMMWSRVMSALGGEFRDFARLGVLGTPVQHL
eukprot:RCo030560